MTKKVHFTEKSDICCKDCGIPLKKNLVHKHNIGLCYICFNITKGKKILKYYKKPIVSSRGYHTKIVDLLKKQENNIKTYKHEKK